MQIPLNQTSRDVPPFHYLTEVLEHCPTAGATYLMLWQDKDDFNTVVLDKKKLCDQYMISLSKFRSDIRRLAKENVISYDETPKMFWVELTDWEQAIAQHSV